MLKEVKAHIAEQLPEYELEIVQLCPFLGCMSDNSFSHFWVPKGCNTQDKLRSERFKGAPLFFAGPQEVPAGGHASADHGCSGAIASPISSRGKNSLVWDLGWLMTN